MHTFLAFLWREATPTAGAHWQPNAYKVLIAGCYTLRERHDFGGDVPTDAEIKLLLDPPKKPAGTATIADNWAEAFARLSKVIGEGNPTTLPAECVQAFNAAKALNERTTARPFGPTSQDKRDADKAKSEAYKLEVKARRALASAS
jgi:hypothetical protein